MDRLSSYHRRFLSSLSNTTSTFFASRIHQPETTRTRWINEFLNAMPGNLSRGNSRFMVIRACINKVRLRCCRHGHHHQADCNVARLQRNSCSCLLLERPTLAEPHRAGIFEGMPTERESNRVSRRFLPFWCAILSYPLL